MVRRACLISFTPREVSHVPVIPGVKRPALKSAALVLAAVVVALALAEGMVRVFAPHSRDHVIPRGLFAIDNTLGWRLEPFASVRHHTRLFDVRYATNSFGFRDPPRTVARASDVRRLLFLGDSYTFGWGVDRDESFVGRLDSDSLEAWNLGVPGYAFDQAVISYEKVGSSVNATDVVFLLARPLLRRMQSADMYHKPKPQFVLDSAGSLTLRPISAAAAGRSSVFYRMLSPFYLPYFLEVQMMLLESGRVRGSIEQRNPKPLSPELIRLTLALLERAKTSANERHQRISVLVLLPRASADIIQEFCARNGIGFIPGPWEQIPLELVLGKYDGHWNAEGHRLVAEKLRSYFASSDSIVSSIGASSR